MRKRRLIHFKFKTFDPDLKFRNAFKSSTLQNSLTFFDAKTVILVGVIRSQPAVAIRLQELYK